MRIRTGLVLAVLALLLGGLYYVVDIHGRAAREQARAAERRIVSFDPAQVEELAIEKGTERVVVRTDGVRWRIIAPVTELADDAVVDGLLAFVGRLEKVRSLEGFDDLKVVGLDPPQARLRLALRNGERLTLQIGSPNPVRTGVYAALEGAPLIFLAPTQLAIELAKTPYVDELRDRAILPLDVERVARVEIARADTHIAIERVADRRWRVTRPFHGDGDDGIIRDLLWKIGASRAGAVIRTPGRPASYGLDRPHARLTVVDDRGVSRALAVSQSPSDSRVVYARVDGTPAVQITDGQLLADLTIAPDVFRNRQLLVYDRREVERITIRYPTDTLVLERAGDRWRVTKPVEGEAVRTTVENILEVLPNLRYATAHPRTESDLRGYGLSPPRLAVTIGLAGGRELPTLAVGREEGGRYFVMVGTAAPVYTVDARLLRVIPADPADAKRYPLPEQVKRNMEKIEQGRR